MTPLAHCTTLAAAILITLLQPHAAAAAEAAPGKDDAARLDALQVVARGTAADTPDVLTTTHLDARDAMAAPADFQDLVTRVPGVDATGQNGLFETFSIRGNGGNGILVLVGGMPLTSQRRAGVPVAFVEPALLGDIAVTRGPAVTHYGPGALGGAVSIEPRWFDAPLLAAGHASNGDVSNVVAATGSATWSLAAARRDAGDSEAADGSPLRTGYTRTNASLQWRQQFGDFALDALLLPSRGEDIGKSNSRYPARVTDYPEDDHTLGRLRLKHDNGTEVALAGHGQSLKTWNRRPGSPDTFASIRSNDYDLVLQRRFGGERVEFDVGMEYLARRDVSGFDASGDWANRNYSLRDAKEDVHSLFALADLTPTPDWHIELGARASRSDQHQHGADSDDSDAAFTVGAAWLPTLASRLSLNLSSGYRFATLEERFYTGVTAQGDIQGNPDLGSETSTGADLGYAWEANGIGLRAHLWRMDVDDLIQLAAIGPDLNGYINVADARLHGAEAELDWSPAGPWHLRLSAARTRGSDRASGEPVYGIGPPSASLETRYEHDAWSLGARYAHRDAMRRPGFEEVARASVDTIDADLRLHPSPRWEIQLYARNALDQRYFGTADTLSALAPGRSIGVNLEWRGM